MMNSFDLFNVHTLFLLCLIVPLSIAFLGWDANDLPVRKGGKKS